MTPSKAVAYFCLFFVGGIFFSPAINSLQILFVFLLFLVFLYFVFWRKKSIFFMILSLAFLTGAWCYQLAWQEVKDSELHILNSRAGEVTFIGQVIKEPDVRDKNTKLTVGKVEIVESYPKPIEGSVLITTNKYPKYEYGDKLKIRGTLESPTEFPDFNYKEYLIKDGVYSVSYYPKVELIENRQGNFILAGIFNLKEKLRKEIFRNLSPP